MKINIKTFLTGGRTQFNVSVSEPRRKKTRSAVLFLMQKFWGLSWSEIVCDAVIAFAESFGWTWTE